ncbi:MAG: HAD family phosphatase [Candidatus Methanomethylophilaceae archaeon]|jgi:phosphoserine phosphatase
MSKRFDLVVFDMDGVLTTTRSSWSFIHDVLGVNNEESYQAFVNMEIDEPEFMRRDIAIWKTIRPNITVNDIARMFRDLPLIDGIQETIIGLKYNNIKSVICSGGIDLAAKMIANEFGFDGYIADTLESYPDGRLTGEGKMNVDLKDKGKNVRDFIKQFGTTPDRCVSIGNSFTDIKMFQNTGTSIAFNPVDPYTEAAATNVVKSKNISDILDIIFFEIEDRN